MSSVEGHRLEDPLVRQRGALARGANGGLNVARPHTGRVALDQVRPFPPNHRPDPTNGPCPLHRVFPYFCTNSAMRAPSSARDAMPSFRYTRLRVASTVFGLTDRAAATSRFDIPVAASSATPRS